MKYPFFLSVAALLFLAMPVHAEQLPLPEAQWDCDIEGALPEGFEDAASRPKLDPNRNFYACPFGECAAGFNAAMDGCRRQQNECGRTVLRGKGEYCENAMGCVEGVAMCYNKASAQYVICLQKLRKRIKNAKDLKEFGTGR